MIEKSKETRPTLIPYQIWQPKETGEELACLRARRQVISKDLCTCVKTGIISEDNRFPNDQKWRYARKLTKDLQVGYIISLQFEEKEHLAYYVDSLALIPISGF